VKVKVINLDNKEVGEVSLNSDIYKQELRKDILHKVVAWQRAKKRAGTHKTKGISDISGTTKKPFKQKGTGNARQGSLRSPQFRGGAVIFGPVVRDHEYPIQKKVKKLALKIALSAKLSEKKLVIIDSLGIKNHKTKDLKTKLNKIGVSSVLIIGLDTEKDINFTKAYRNIKNVDALPTNAINVYDILNHDHLVLSRASVDMINERLS
jgi:large subunit ribosomal protein L4